ncbi:MAG: restriction endonuclease [Bacteroidota bacterium]
MDWRDYEHYIHRHLQRMYPGTSIRHDVKLPGKLSGVPRQVDILISGELAGFELKIAVECKHLGRKVDVKVVEAFISFCQDVGANKGVIITNGGYSEAALNRAHHDTQDVELRIVNLDDLEESQSVLAVAYSGSRGVLISAPPGWVVDARPILPVPAALYPLGLQQEEAIGAEGYAYVGFWQQDEEAASVEELEQLQSLYVREAFPEAEISVAEELKRTDLDSLVARSDGMETYNGPEYRLYLDAGDFIVFVVMLAPENRAESYYEKLIWIGEYLVPVDVSFGDQPEPVSS